MSEDQLNGERTFRETDGEGRDIKFRPLAVTRPTIKLGRPPKSYSLRSVDVVKLTNLNNVSQSSASDSNCQQQVGSSDSQTMKKPTGILIPVGEPIIGERVGPGNKWELLGCLCYAFGLESLFHLQLSLRPGISGADLMISFRSCSKVAANIAPDVVRWSITVRTLDKFLTPIDTKVLTKEGEHVQHFVEMDTTLYKICSLESIYKNVSAYSWKMRQSAVSTTTGSCDVVQLELDFSMDFGPRSEVPWKAFSCVPSLEPVGKLRSFGETETMILQLANAGVQSSSETQKPRAKKPRVQPSSMYGRSVDLIVGIEKSEFHVYWKILNDYCPAFLKEVEGKESPVVLPNLSSGALQVFLDVLHKYPQTANCSWLRGIDATTLKEVLQLYQNYNVSLGKEFVQQLVKQVTLDLAQALEMYKFGYENGLPHVVQVCIQFLKSNPQQMNESSGRRLLEKLNSKVLASIVADLV